MECIVRWGDGMTFVAETGSKHLVTMDGAPESGGRNLAPRPMEVLLSGAGGCTAYDVVVILKKNGQDVSGCEVELSAERAATDPKVFTKIHYHFTVRGRNLKRNLVEQSVRLSHEKYCSATAMHAKVRMIWFIGATSCSPGRSGEASDSLRPQSLRRTLDMRKPPWDGRDGSPANAGRGWRTATTAMPPPTTSRVRKATPTSGNVPNG